MGVLSLLSVTGSQLCGGKVEQVTCLFRSKVTGWRKVAGLGENVVSRWDFGLSLCMGTKGEIYLVTKREDCCSCRDWLPVHRVNVICLQGTQLFFSSAAIKCSHVTEF